MKANIHPKWYPSASVSCYCGNKFTIGLTVAKMDIEICSKCHPFYTGEMKYVDTLGRVEKFQQKQQQATLHMTQVASNKKKARQEEQERASPKTLKEMLKSIQNR